jgi:hypothetical protein
MSNRQQRRRLARRRSKAGAAIVGGGALAFALIPVGTAQAEPITVTNLHDSGLGSLRAAIVQANSDRTIEQIPDLITFASGLTGSIKLRSPLPEIYDSIDIYGPSARRITVDASQIQHAADVAVFEDLTSDTELTISGLSLDDAHTGNTLGGFIETQYTDLTLNNDAFVHDHSQFAGGAVFSTYGSLKIDGCTFNDDGAQYGGALLSELQNGKIDDSTFANNSASLGGGAIGLFQGDTTTITGSTITGNSVKYRGSSPDQLGYGGGIDSLYASLDLRDSVVAENKASGNTHANRRRQGGSDFPDIHLIGSAFTAAFSLIQHGFGLGALPAGNIRGKDPLLGRLADNGGPTNTELPLSGSPVINAGKAFGLWSDQRGDKRTVDYPGVKKRKGSDGTDIGAVELQPPKKQSGRR